MVLHDAAGAVIDEWVVPSTVRSPPLATATLPLSGALPPGGYRLPSVGGTFDAPVSEQATVSSGIETEPTTTTGPTTTTDPESSTTATERSTTEVPSAGPPAPVMVEPALTG